MERDKLFDGLFQRYAIIPQYLWAKHPDFAVFRHNNRKNKWFCLYMPLNPEKIGRSGSEQTAVLNVKCPPERVGALRQINGILPAYHMNKEHWVSIVINEADDDLIWWLVDESFKLTQ